MLTKSSEALVQPIHLMPASARATLSPLAMRLRQELKGDVLFDRAARGRYATDASIYQIMRTCCLRWRLHATHMFLCLHAVPGRASAGRRLAKRWLSIQASGSTISSTSTVMHAR